MRGADVLASDQCGHASPRRCDAPPGVRCRRSCALKKHSRLRSLCAARFTRQINHLILLLVAAAALAGPAGEAPPNHVYERLFDEISDIVAAIDLHGRYDLGALGAMLDAWFAVQLRTPGARLHRALALRDRSGRALLGMKWRLC
jgi:hypothetical protein